MSQGKKRLMQKNPMLQIHSKLQAKRLAKVDCKDQQATEEMPSEAPEQKAVPASDPFEPVTKRRRIAD